MVDSKRRMIYMCLFEINEISDPLEMWKNIISA